MSRSTGSPPPERTIVSRGHCRGSEADENERQGHASAGARVSQFAGREGGAQDRVAQTSPFLANREGFWDSPTSAAIGVLSVVVLALRPECSAQARMPPTARSAPRGARRGLLVLTAGPVAYFSTGVTHHPGGRVPTW
jgi:hypothetical protein